MHQTKKRLNLIYKAQIRQITGLERDALILQNILRQQYCINHYKITERRKLKALGIPQYLPARISAYLKTRTAPFDANIFLEKIRPELLHLAKLNILIPNHEMFSRNSVSWLQKIDLVLCKTKYAETIFSQLHPRTEYISFTSLDRYNSQIQTDYTQFFHLAGKSVPRRGTYQILELWKANTHWPHLTVVAHKLEDTPYQNCHNISIYNSWINDQDLKELQNQIGIHICVSEAEGFGHFIVEAMSAYGCAITTDAPPMNEIINPERGYLVSVSHRETPENYFDQRSYFSIEALQKTIDTLIHTSVKNKQEKGKLARQYYEQNDRQFQAKLTASLENLWAE